MLGIIVGVAIFACTALLAVEVSRYVCTQIDPLDGAPPASEPPTLLLAMGAAFLGAVLVTRGAQPVQFAIFGVVVFALAACWASDSLRGILPDVFTLIPLGIVLIVGLSERDWLMLVSAAALFVPFAIAAWSTKGRGMGWGDVKLVALAGAALGAPLAMLAMVAACILAVIGYRIKHLASGPIAFAPYIAVAVGVAIPLGIGR